MASNNPFTYWAERLEGVAQDKLQKEIIDIGLEILEQMTTNLSGDDVTWSGGVFHINVRTGNLRRRTAIEYPYNGDQYSTFVYNNAEYAGVLEGGISGQDRKEMLLSSPKAKRSKRGRRYLPIPIIERNSLTGFWTVHEQSNIKDQKPRPFVKATAEQMKDRINDRLGKAFMEIVSG